MSGEVVELGDRRPKVCYTVRLTQDYIGGLTVFVEDVADDPRSRQAVADALRKAAELIEERLRLE